MLKVTVTRDGDVIEELTGSDVIVVTMAPDGSGDNVIVNDTGEASQGRACLLLALCVLSQEVRTKYPDLLGYLTNVLRLMPPSTRCPRILAEQPSPN